MFHLSYQIENRFIHLGFNEHHGNSRRISNNLMSQFGIAITIKYLVSLVFRNISFILLLLSAFWNLVDLYYCYSLISVIICPLKLWMPLIAIYLRHKCSNLAYADFERFIDMSKFENNNTNQLNYEKQQLLDEKQAKSFLGSSNQRKSTKNS